MRKYWFIILQVIYETALMAQPVISDSLRDAIQNRPNDTSKVKRLIIAAEHLPYIQSDSTLYYVDSIIRLSEKIDYLYGIAKGYSLKGEAYLYSGDYSKAINYFSQSMRIYEASGDRYEIYYVYSQFAELYRELGNYRQALEYDLRARGILNSVGDSRYDRLTELFELTPHNDPGIALTYLSMGMTDSALKYGKLVFNRFPYWSFSAVLLGDIYSAKKDYAQALLSYNMRTSTNWPVDSAKNFIGKSNVFKQINQPDSCSIFALQALDISQRINYLKGIMQASEIMSFIYEKTDLPESIKYLKISNTVKDSLYSKSRISQVNSIAFNDELRKLDAIAAEKAARNKYKIWSLIGIMFTLLVTGILLWRNNQHKKKANILLQKEKHNVEQTLEKLKSTQTQLIQVEKMASLGELTAGIAHEIQNPLNFVNNFSEVNKELIDEMQQEMEKGNLPNAKAISNDIKENEEKISHHGKRADSIVKGMLQHSRTTSGQMEPTDINALADEYLRLSYHGMRAKDKTFNAILQTDFDKSSDKISVIPQDIGRVLLNLYNNAFHSMMEKVKLNYPGYEPIISVSSGKLDGKAIITVKDNGMGIAENIKDKIFQPFFTTKPTGQGTGLGLSLAYDIVKAHGGEIVVQTEEGHGSEFTIRLPS